MRQTEFQKLREFEDEDDMKDLKEGDIFLYGQNVIGQKQHKMVGDAISYYKVIAKVGKDISYAPIFDNLEEDREKEN
jgi:hypothetical protein